MKRLRIQRPSPGTIIAMTALVVAVGGTAIAGPLANKSALSKSEKKQTKKLAQSEIQKAAPTLSVANADTVDGLDATALKVVSAATVNIALVSLTGAYTPVATVNITTQAPSRILATGSVEMTGDTSDERAQCKLVIDGVSGPETETTFDDINTNNEAVVSMDFSVSRPAGTYTATVQCAALSGTVGKDDASINVWGIPD